MKGEGWSSRAFPFLGSIMCADVSSNYTTNWFQNFVLILLSMFELCNCYAAWSATNCDVASRSIVPKTAIIRKCKKNCDAHVADDHQPSPQRPRGRWQKNAGRTASQARQSKHFFQTGQQVMMNEKKRVESPERQTKISWFLVAKYKVPMFHAGRLYATDIW